MSHSQFAALSILTLFTAVPCAKAVDREKLRRAVHLPEITILMGYTISAQGDFVSLTELEPQPEKIAVIEKELKGNATDAERYCSLGHLSYQIGQRAKAEEAYRKAESILRKKMAQYPNENGWRLHLADVLMHLKADEEAEIMLRRMVKDFPNDWHAWIGLGRLLDSKSVRVLTGGERFRGGCPDDLLQWMRAAAPTKERIAESMRLRQEAAACFDRAIALAPREPEAHRQRGAFRFHYGPVNFALRSYKGEKVDFFVIGLSPESQPDLRRAVNLSLDDYLGIGSITMMEWMADAYEFRLRNGATKQPRNSLDVLSPRNQKQLREDMDRLARGIENPDKRKAAEALEVLGCLQLMILKDSPTAETIFRRCLALDTSRDAAWEMLLAVVRGTKGDHEAANLCLQRLQQKDSTRNRLLLAKVYESQKQLDKAEEAIRRGLKLQADDFMLNLTLADLLLMRCENDDLKNAGEILFGLGNDRNRQRAGKDLWNSYRFACGIYCGLIGGVQSAREWLGIIQKRNPQYPHLEEALKGLDEADEFENRPGSLPVGR